jgi:hypothetical protein
LTLPDAIQIIDPALLKGSDLGKKKNDFAYINRFFTGWKER